MCKPGNKVSKYDYVSIVHILLQLQMPPKQILSQKFAIKLHDCETENKDNEDLFIYLTLYCTHKKIQEKTNKDGTKGEYEVHYIKIVTKWPPEYD